MSIVASLLPHKPTLQMSPAVAGAVRGRQWMVTSLNLELVVRMQSATAITNCSEASHPKQLGKCPT